MNEYILEYGSGWATTELHFDSLYECYYEINRLELIRNERDITVYKIIRRKKCQGKK